MSLGETVLLGAIAGSTIFLSLPFGRAQLKDDRMRVALAMFSVGILAFLFVDVLEHGFAIVEAPVEEKHLGTAIGLVLLLGGGFFAGIAGPSWLERRMRPAGPTRPPLAGGDAAAATMAPGALGRGMRPAGPTRPPLAGGDAAAATMAPGALAGLNVEAAAARTRALNTGLVIAAAIGIHNFAEGLAIGVSAQAGEIGLATVL